MNPSAVWPPPWPGRLVPCWRPRARPAVPAPSDRLGQAPAAARCRDPHRCRGWHARLADRRDRRRGCPARRHCRGTGRPGLGHPPKDHHGGRLNHARFKRCRTARKPGPGGSAAAGIITSADDRRTRATVHRLSPRLGAARRGHRADRRRQRCQHSRDIAGHTGGRGPGCSRARGTGSARRWVIPVPPAAARSPSSPWPPAWSPSSSAAAS